MKEILDAMYIVLKKKKIHMKKTPSKVAHNRPNFFSNTGTVAQTAPK